MSLIPAAEVKRSQARSATDAQPVTAEALAAEALIAEKEVLGFYLSGHPLSEHEWELDHYVTPLHELEELPDGSSSDGALRRREQLLRTARCCRVQPNSRESFPS